MSALGFQKALAQLIRYPDRHVESVIETWKDELSSEDLIRLRTAAKDPLVAKYGQKMQFVRHREAMGVLRFSREVIPSSVLDPIYYRDFEPTRTTTDSLWIGVEFMNFVLTHEKSLLSIRQNAPTWGVDCLKYENAKSQTVREIPRETDDSLPSGSLLKTGAFRIRDRGLSPSAKRKSQRVD